MTNLTLEFKKALETSVKELTDLLTKKDYEGTIAASEEIKVYLKECAKLLELKEAVVNEIQYFAEQANIAIDQPVTSIIALESEDAKETEERRKLFESLNPTIKVGTQQEQEQEQDDTEEKIGLGKMFRNFIYAGKKRNKSEVE